MKTLVNPSRFPVQVTLSDGSVHVVKGLGLVLVDADSEIVEVVPVVPATGTIPVNGSASPDANHSTANILSAADKISAAGETA